jgi:hypothetical protein
MQKRARTQPTARFLPQAELGGWLRAEEIFFSNASVAITSSGARAFGEGVNEGENSRNVLHQAKRIRKGKESGMVVITRRSSERGAGRSQAPFSSKFSSSQPALDRRLTFPVALAGRSGRRVLQSAVVS